MNRMTPVALRPGLTFPGPPQLEHAMHKHFASARLHNEWFSIDDDLALFIGRCAASLLSRHSEALQ